MSVMQLAECSGISRSTLHNWEAAKTAPRVPELEGALRCLRATQAQHARALSLLNAARGHRILDASDSPYESMTHRGDLLRALRVRRGWSQGQVAQTLSVQQTTVSRWEKMALFPSAEALERLCDALGALPEERAALRSPDLLLTNWPARPTLEQCAQQLDYIEVMLRRRNFALIDLYALALKRQLRLLAHDSPEAVRLLAHTEEKHSHYLAMMMRYRESRDAAWSCLSLIRGSRRPEQFWTSAINIASLCAGSSRTDYKAKVSLVRRWIPFMPMDALRVRLLCDMAYYSSKVPGNEAEAGAILDAAFTMQKAAQPDCAESHAYVRLTAGRIYTGMGRYQDAMACLPELRAYTLPNVELMLYWIGLYVSMGERSEAARLLSELDRLLQRHPVPNVRSTANQLALAL